MGYQHERPFMVETFVLTVTHHWLYTLTVRTSLLTSANTIITTYTMTLGLSVWKAPNRMWKSRRKFRLLYFILITQLRGKVKKLHAALLLFIWVMRRLDGQVHSFEQATSLGILPGSRSVAKDGLDELKISMILALVLIEGAVPPSSLKPGVKHFVHYPRFTKTHGLLRILWMMAFERCVTTTITITVLTTTTLNVDTHHSLTLCAQGEQIQQVLDKKSARE